MRGIAIFLGALFLMSAAFYNGYPIVYSDTSTYLVSGFEFKPPFDRPITYGLFIALTSLYGVSLGLVVFAQAALVSYLIFLFAREFATIYNPVYILVTIVLLSFFTGASWTVGQIIADIFTPIMLLCMAILLFGNPSRREQYVLYFLFVLSCTAHIAHINFNVVLLLCTFALGLLKVIPKPRAKPFLILCVLTIISVLPMLVAISKSKHAFLMGAMVEHGIAKKYLDEHCGEKQFRLCAYKDSLNYKAWEFMWDEDSPLNSTGGWKANKEEYNEIIRGTLTEPRFILLHVKESLQATVLQLMRFRINDGNGPVPENSLLRQRVAKYFPGELEEFENSRQNRDALQLTDKANLLFYAIMVVTFVLLASLWYKGTFQHKPVVIFLITAIILNAWVCGTFSTAIDRYGCKVIWLLPLILMLELFSYFSTRQRGST